MWGLAIASDFSAFGTTQKILLIPTKPTVFHSRVPASCGEVRNSSISRYSVPPLKNLFVAGAFSRERAFREALLKFSRSRRSRKNKKPLPRERERLFLVVLPKTN